MFINLNFVFCYSNEQHYFCEALGSSLLNGEKWFSSYFSSIFQVPPSSSLLIISDGLFWCQEKHKTHSFPVMHNGEDKYTIIIVEDVHTPLFQSG